MFLETPETKGAFGGTIDLFLFARDMISFSPI